jgi:glycosyltransferase involved in cell wall biosynthesis
MNLKIDVIIPAFNEELTIGQVVRSISPNIIRRIVVVDNGSSDGTAKIASENGATVVSQPQKGYGNACLAGIKFLENQSEPPNVVVFLDADFSDDPEDFSKIIEPILSNQADLVIGSRMLGKMEKGAMTFPQKFGNWLAPALIRLFWKVHFTDLGPFRAIRFEDLLRLKMADKNFGWTVEMQVKAAKQQLRCVEVPANYRRRGGGKSKVSGTIRGTFLAGYKILWTIFKSL